MISENLYLFFILTLLLFLSCETNPPNLVEFESYSVKLEVVSNIEGASIYLDDIFTEKVTPDTIETNLGEHKITLLKDGYFTNSAIINVEMPGLRNIYVELSALSTQKVVLIEDFANVSCDPCVISNEILKNLEYKLKSNIAVIKFSTNFPSPNDPFYLSNKISNDSRMDYYNVLFAPTIIVDGIARPIATDSSDILETIETRLQLLTPFDIEVIDSFSNNRIFVIGKITKLNNELDVSEYRVFTSIIEKQIILDSPPGSNGEIEFFNVCRALLPYADGYPLNSISLGEDFIFDSELGNNWKLENLHTITFIQKYSTGEVVQSVISEN